LYLQGKQAESERLYAELESTFQRAIESGETIWSPTSDKLACADTISMSTRDEATLQRAMKRLTEVEMAIKADKFLTSWWHGVFAEIQHRLAQDEDAIRHSQLMSENVTSENPEDLYGPQKQLVRLLSQAGRYDQAEEVLRTAAAKYEERLGDDHVVTNYARVDLAEFLIPIKKYAEAEALLQNAQEALLAEPRLPASERERTIVTLAKLYDATDRPADATTWRAKLNGTSTVQANPQ
jgi:tetratricopeptide (TPR) repeat protein